MNWSDPLPTLVFAALAALVGLFLALVASRRKEDKLTPTLGCLVMASLSSLFAIAGVANDVPSGWEGVVLLRLLELPIVVFTSVLYVSLAGGFRRLRAEEGASLRVLYPRPRLHTALLWSPWVLGGAWLYSLVVELFRPITDLHVYAAAPPSSFFLSLPILLPPMIYLAVGAWVCGKSVRASMHKVGIVKYLAFTTALSLWLVSNVNVLARFWASSFLDNPVRTNLIDAQYVFQDLLFMPFAASLVIALLTTVAGAVSIGNRDRRLRG